MEKLSDKELMDKIQKDLEEIKSQFSREGNDVALIAQDFEENLGHIRNQFSTQASDSATYDEIDKLEEKRDNWKPS